MVSNHSIVGPMVDNHHYHPIVLKKLPSSKSSSTHLFQFGLCPVECRSCHHIVTHKQPAEWVNWARKGIVWVGRGVRLQKGVRFTTDGNPMPILLPPVLVHFCQLPTLWQQCIWSVSMPFVKLKPAVGWLVDCQFYCPLSQLCGNPPQCTWQHPICVNVDQVFYLSNR